MERLEFSHCECNNYTELFALLEFFDEKCPKVSKPETNNESCCELNCQFSDNHLVVDKKINKTALSKLYGHDGDPKFNENFEKCEAMSKIFVTNIAAKY